MVAASILLLFIWSVLVVASKPFQESLHLKPLPKNGLLASFQFEVESLPGRLDYFNDSAKDESQLQFKSSHYTYFPRTLGPIIESTNTRQLHLRFTQGWWDSKSWGSLPLDGFKSGGTGVEMWTVIEAPDLESAKKNWFKLAESLSGFFCASLNFIDDSITTLPKFNTESREENYVADPSNQLFLLRAALPSEPICTENLTPFLKLIPTRGKAGISSLLDGHKVFDSLWHSMSIDVKSECFGNECKFKMNQSINSVIDITRSLRRSKEGGIPKPTRGEDLRCDLEKEHDIWKCFPLPDPTDLSWNLELIYGKKIKGPAFKDDPNSSIVYIDVEPKHWNVNVEKSEGDSFESLVLNDGSKSRIQYNIEDDSFDYDFSFETENSTVTLPVDSPPLHVSRSLTGYSQDQGGVRVSFRNPFPDKPVQFVYFESLPWFIRLYLHTLTLEGDGFIKQKYYKPAIDRVRPSHLEFLIEIPAGGSLAMTFQFDKSLLLYAEYPPDANHGFTIEPAVISILNDESETVYQLRTTSLLLSLPTPDFSMPYNVIILTCTVMSLAFGSVFNLLTKKVITEEELEKITEASKLAQLKQRVKEKVSLLKSMFKPAN